MAILERDTPLPEAMQGRWLDPEDPTTVLIIDGAEITCFGKSVAYDYKEVEEDEGALTVTLKIDDESREDTFSVKT